MILPKTAPRQQMSGHNQHIDSLESNNAERLFTTADTYNSFYVYDDSRIIWISEAFPAAVLFSVLTSDRLTN